MKAREKVPEHFKEKCRQQSLDNTLRRYYVNGGFQSNIFWVSPIEDSMRNIMCYDRGVCIWNKEEDKPVGLE